MCKRDIGFEAFSKDADWGYIVGKIAKGNSEKRRKETAEERWVGIKSRENIPARKQETVLCYNRNTFQVSEILFASLSYFITSMLSVPCCCSYASLPSKFC